MKHVQRIGWALALFAIAGCKTTPTSEEAKKAQTAEVEAAIEKFKLKQKGVETYLKDSHAYAVFPSVAKAGWWVGGAGGRGQVFEKGEMVGYAKLSAASIGFQFGGQSFSEIVFFENEAAFAKFKTGEFGFDANANAVAATAGVAAKADYKNGVAVFVMAQAGLMYEASIGGQKFDYEPK